MFKILRKQRHSAGQSNVRVPWTVLLPLKKVLVLASLFVLILAVSYAIPKFLPTIQPTAATSPDMPTTQSLSEHTSIVITESTLNPTTTQLPSEATTTTQPQVTHSTTSHPTIIALPTTGKATPAPSQARLDGYIVVIDPGHQRLANYAQDPISPGSTITRPKTKAGTSGVATGRPEYEVNLEIALKLQRFLQDLGCTVYMTRTTNDVSLSNIERAQFAQSYQPDVYLRLHCDGSADASRHGIGVFVADTGIYKDQLPAWGQHLIDSICARTGARAGKVNASSNYPGLNWATDIPNFLIEMGYMTNPAEDRLLSNPEYQDKICQGIADFVAGMPNSVK
jgi:N-acetylmuramoyl-L-alanine amidase